MEAVGLFFTQNYTRNLHVGGVPLLLSCIHALGSTNGVRAQRSHLFIINLDSSARSRNPSAGTERGTRSHSWQTTAAKGDLHLLGLRKQFHMQWLSNPCSEMAQKALPRPCPTLEGCRQLCTLSVFPGSFKSLCIPKSSPGAQGADHYALLHPGYTGRTLSSSPLPFHTLLANV